MTFAVPGEELEYFVIGGENLEDVLKNYTTLTGKPALPPAYSFGLWLSTSFTTNYDEATVNSFIDGMAERDIPLQVFHFDCFWMKEYEWCNFEWDKRQFPNPPAMLKKLHDKGLMARPKAFLEHSGGVLPRRIGRIWRLRRFLPQVPQLSRQEGNFEEFSRKSAA